ncbi:MAG: STAS domain-containing protein [Spirochaetes bacterium]|nr:STAS domain-containing protein [Spirochaetota bacterium]HPA70730.1 STAS domain-containing protein [Spirochaetota bacterium]
MEIKIQKVNQNLVIVKIDGRFNIEEVITFEKAINDIIDQGPKAVSLNMSELKYIDSSGIGSLIKAMNIAKNKDIELVITDLDKEIMHIFKLAYLDRFFTICTQEEILNRYP